MVADNETPLYCCTKCTGTTPRRCRGVPNLATIIIGSSLEEFFFFLSSKARIDFEYIIGAPRRKKNNGLGTHTKYLEVYIWQNENDQ